MYAERLPPHDIDAEDSVLGSLLINGDAMPEVAPLLNPEDFYRESNRWCYKACLGLYDRGVAIDQVSVENELSRLEKLTSAGGAAYLSQLISVVPTSAHIEHYARIVHRMAMMRRIIESAGQISKIGYEAGPDEDEALSKAEDILFQLRSGQGSRDFVHIKDVMGEFFEEGGFERENGEGPLSVALTGFHNLDTLLGGLHRSDLIVLAARPSLGKSSLALNIARTAALKQGARVAIFSLEMGIIQVVQRLLSCESGVDTRNFRLDESGVREFSPEEKTMVVRATGSLGGAEIYIDDSPFLTIVELRSKAKRLHMENDLDLIIVDYIGLMLQRGDNNVSEMSEITRSLKLLARDLNVPLLALSQLSRAPELRNDHRPMLSDLRESGSIEQDADVVMFIYKADRYYDEQQWNKLFPDQMYPKGIADIIVGKHRNGPTGTVQLRFVDHLAKFEPLPVGVA